MSQMGIAPERVTIEDKSRNTDENARFTAAISILSLRSLDRRHLRLSYAARDGPLRKSRISPDRLSRSFSHPGSVARRSEIDLRAGSKPQGLRDRHTQWIGLAAYRASGRIDHLFPGPGDSA